ncbi:unnamed protein product [Boreogadus saida]
MAETDSPSRPGARRGLSVELQGPRSRARAPEQGGGIRLLPHMQDVGAQPWQIEGRLGSGTLHFREVSC